MTPIVPAAPAGAAAPVAAAPAAGPRPTRSFGQVLHDARRGCPAGAGAPSPAAEPARRILAAVDRARERLDGVLAAARSGRVFSAQELLGLQAEAYRTTQTVDLAVKVAEQGAQSVRQALQAQV